MSRRATPLKSLLGWLLCAQLLILPPGLAVCWSLPGGLHLHIGWTDASGQATLSPQVMLHGPSEPPADPTHSSPPAATHPATALLGSPLAAPPTDAWRLPVVTLTWLWLGAALVFAAVAPPPLRQPPRWLAAL